MWFSDLVGFEEVSSENVRNNILLDGDKLISKVNGKSFRYGTLEVASLKELKQRSSLNNCRGSIQVREIVGDVQKLHCDPQNRHALFQAASQFNLLEMIGPHISPENGIDIYDQDRTQGPACAIACGAGTIYRNYFAPVNGQEGQTSTNQIDCLDQIGNVLGNEESAMWKMTNGYAMATQEGLLAINSKLDRLTPEEREHLKEKLRIGVQWGTEVTIGNSRQLVSQAYCSALPVAYSQVDSFHWESFGRLILEATYEATLHAALINLEQTDCNKVFLTLVGGGAFGNQVEWINDSMLRALTKFRNTPLEIGIISYGASNPDVVALIDRFNGHQ